MVRISVGTSALTLARRVLARRQATESSALLLNSPAAGHLLSGVAHPLDPLPIATSDRHQDLELGVKCRAQAVQEVVHRVQAQAHENSFDFRLTFALVSATFRYQRLLVAVLKGGRLAGRLGDGT